VLATGGTASAACALLESLGAEVVGVHVLLELGFLGGRATLGERDVRSLLVEA
jgi:adenine phosphoribosyltransferase